MSLFDSASKGLKFDQIGTAHTGTVKSAPRERQQTKFGSQEPDFWPNGDPKMQILVDLAAQFDISPEAVKKQSRIFKSVIKLDRNFHIYVHGRTDLIEKGVDMDGRKYYKIYYQDEG